jgi:Ca-activated chloride channel family protein
MMFMHPIWFLALALLPVAWFVFRPKTYIGHSNVVLVDRSVKQTWLHKIPFVLFSLAFIALVFALANPQARVQQGKNTIKSRDIILAVDISGSMSEVFDGKVPEKETGETELDKEFPTVAPPKNTPNYYGSQQDARIGKRRIDAAQAAIMRFVRNRYKVEAGDRIGILMFDDMPHWSWPLTDDLKMIYRKGIFVNQSSGGGTNFGNIEPGPIDAAAEHFDERGQSATKVLILVSDGEDSINPNAMDRLMDHIAHHNMRLYVISVGNKNTPADLDILNLATSVNGAIFRVQDAQSLVDCFDSIDQMERTPVEVDMQATYETRFYYFAAACIVFCLGAIVSETFIVHP